MITVKPIGGPLGATVEGLDLSEPMSDDAFGQVLAALGRYGVLRFPDQRLDPVSLKAFSERFGDVQTSSRGDKTEHPGVSTLSNIKRDGTYIGSPDAGQDWHTDMSYRDVMGFVNVLYGITVPRRDGKVLGGTEFSSMHAAYEGLPAEIKTRLATATATHDFSKFWDHMRRDKNSTRPPMTEEQRRRRPPVTHPLFLTHPITGRKILYANPGYTTRINELPEGESAEMLEFLFDHQLRPEYRYVHSWTEKDLLIWDNLGTVHRAIADYRPDEHRHMIRCQVLATRVFEPGFVQPPTRHQATA